MTLPPVTGLVTMIYVADVARAAAFYRLLGFEIGNYVPRGGEPMHWAWLYSPAAADWKRGPNLMLTCRAAEPGPRKVDDVLLYLYAPDLQAMREQLLTNGISAGEIEFPDYLPKGEFCVTDPDGHTLMIAQAADDTP